MSIGSILSRAIPTAIGFATGGPVGATTAFYATEQAKKEERQIKQQINAENTRRMKEMEFFGSSGSSIPTITANMQRTTPIVSTASSGGGFFDTVRGGLREVGGLVSDVFNTGIPQLFGVGRTGSVRQQPAITTTTNLGAQESQGSGTIQAGIGSALPSLLQAGRSLLKSPAGQLAIGGGVALGGSMFGGQQSGMRITRKMKSQARMVLNMTGGNISATADMLNISEDMLVTILLKRFRNDGPVVTKAALRKTKQTIRRLHSMQDVLKSMTPTSTGRRRAPMKRATTTTLIKN